MKSSRRLFTNDVVMQERREHVLHHLFTQRQYSNPLLVPHYIIELQPSGSVYLSLQPEDLVHCMNGIPRLCLSHLGPFGSNFGAE
jgi:hypothetical protein